MCGHDAGIDLAPVFAILLAFVTHGLVIADQKRQGRIETVFGANFQLGERIFPVEHQNALRLIIAGSRSHLACSQNEIQLFLFHGLVLELTHRVTHFG